MLYGVCTTLFWSCHLEIMLHKNVQRNQYPSQQGSGPRWKVTNSIKSLWKPQAGWCVQADTRFKAIHFFPPRVSELQLRLSCIMVKLKQSSVAVIHGNKLRASTGSTSAKNLQRAEGCGYVPPALIGPSQLPALSPLLWLCVEKIEWDCVCKLLYWCHHQSLLALQLMTTMVNVES